MNKTEFIAEVAKKAELDKKASEKAVNAVLDVIAGELEKGGKVQFVGFGTFEVRARAAKQGRNPKTGEAIKVPASKAPVFKAGKVLKDSVAK